MASVAQSWAVVVPVKRLELAKTRLSVRPELRRELALAMATDTVAACRHTDGVVDVVVVTDDELAELDAVYGSKMRPDLKKLSTEAKAEANCG